jgi:hypothetical protein
LFAYELALNKTGAWPLEEVLHGKRAKSIDKVLQSLGNFQYETPNADCGLCSRNFLTEIIEPGVESVLRNFGGLCLDCIDKPKKKHTWFGEEFRGEERVWDLHCRINHDEPSWWFFLASKQRPDVQQQEREDRKRKREEEVLGKRYRR